ncbi:MAG: hypothetical protein GY795_37955 [Desulfobacterales bacterium]|nr:hypothetical protein [Desulfobacterales bacterium]
MQIKTVVKDSFLSGILFLATTYAWLCGWIYFGMRWEFLAAPIMYMLMWICCKFNDKRAGVTISIILMGAIYGLYLFILLVAANIPILWPAFALLAFFTALLAGLALTDDKGTGIQIFSLLDDKYESGLSEPAEYIGKLYSKFVNLPIRLSAFMIFPPFVFLLSVYVFSNSLAMSAPWLFYPALGSISSLLLMLLFNCSLLPFHYASDNEKRIWNYIPSYRHLICSRHFFRPFRKRKALFYHDVRCRAKNCSQNEFMTGIKQVTGVIGASSTPSYSEGDMFYISLWSEKTRTARNADIDVLEIRDAEGISYDYAINAVLIELKNDASRLRGYVKQIPVVICGNPPVPEGAKAVLEHEFGKILYLAENRET